MASASASTRSQEQIRQGGVSIETASTSAPSANATKAATAWIGASALTSE